MSTKGKLTDFTLSGVKMDVNVLMRTSPSLWPHPRPEPRPKEKDRKLNLNARRKRKSQKRSRQRNRK